jgi:hypothetical protein
MPLNKKYSIFLKYLKNQEKFNKWTKANVERSFTYKGEDDTVGFVLGWNGNKEVGEGEKEITNLVEGNSVETVIRFVRPIKTQATVILK